MGRQLMTIEQILSILGHVNTGQKLTSDRVCLPICGRVPTCGVTPSRRSSSLITPL